MIIGKNKFLIVVLLVISVLFYWFQIRPSNIRKSCNEVTKGKVLAAEKEGKPYNSTLANSWYRLCLADQGMKPEDLLNDR